MVVDAGQLHRGKRGGAQATGTAVKYRTYLKHEQRDDLETVRNVLHVFPGMTRRAPWQV